MVEIVMSYFLILTAFYFSSSSGKKECNSPWKLFFRKEKFFYALKMKATDLHPNKHDKPHFISLKNRTPKLKT